MVLITLNEHCKIPVEKECTKVLALKESNPGLLCHKATLTTILAQPHPQETIIFVVLNSRRRH